MVTAAERLSARSHLAAPRLWLIDPRSLTCGQSSNKLLLRFDRA